MGYGRRELRGVEAFPYGRGFLILTALSRRGMVGVSELKFRNSILDSRNFRSEMVLRMGISLP